MAGVRQLLSPYFSLEPQVPIREAFEVMCEKGVTSVPVLSEEGRVVGVLAHADIIKMFIEPGSGGLEGTKVADFMTKQVVTESPDSDISELSRQLLNHHFKEIPVVANGKIAGVVSRKDIIRHIIRQDI